MMTVASYSLFAKGPAFHDANNTSFLTAPLQTSLGAFPGLLFILGTKSFLDYHKDVKLSAIGGANARNILHIVFAVTLHSFSKGVGIGVSFGEEHGRGLGVFILVSLTVHNVPEGLLPQALMAVLAFLFVHSVLSLLTVGLGFVGGRLHPVCVPVAGVAIRP